MRACIGVAVLLLLVVPQGLLAEEDSFREPADCIPTTLFPTSNEDINHSEISQSDYTLNFAQEWQARTLRDMGLAKLGLAGAMSTTGVIFITAKFDGERDDYFLGGGIALILASAVPAYYGIDDLKAAHRIHPSSVLNKIDFFKFYAKLKSLNPMLSIDQGYFALTLNINY